MCGEGLNGDGSEFMRGVNIAVPLLKQLEIGIRETVFLDFSEDLALWSVSNDVDSIHLMLNYCIS